MSERAVNLLAIAVGLLVQLLILAYFSGRHTRRADDLQTRVESSERDISQLKADTAKLNVISSQLSDLKTEFERIREKLERFLEAMALRS